MYVAMAMALGVIPAMIVVQALLVYYVCITSITIVMFIRFRIKANVYDIWLAVKADIISRRRLIYKPITKISIVSPWHHVARTYVLLYPIVLFSVTLSDLELPQTTQFSIFFIVFYMFVMD